MASKDAIVNKIHNNVYYYQNAVDFEKDGLSNIQLPVVCGFAKFSRELPLQCPPDCGRAVGILLLRSAPCSIQVGIRTRKNASERVLKGLLMAWMVYPTY